MGLEWSDQARCNSGFWEVNSPQAAYQVLLLKVLDFSDKIFDLLDEILVFNLKLSYRLFLWIKIPHETEGIRIYKCSFLVILRIPIEERKRIEIH
jgi:hypothetical protein